MKKILVIDDEEILTETLADLLERQIYEVKAVLSGDEAVAACRCEEFDLIISDIRMPGMNGIKAIGTIYQNLRESDRWLIPVIFITGYADEEAERQARRLSPVAYLYKPFDTFQLLNLIERTLR